MTVTPVRIALRGLLIAAFAACASDLPTVSAGTSIIVNGGSGQTLQVGTAAASSLSVLVKDMSGAPESGANVTWTIASGGGTIASAGPSGADGIAHATYQAGTTSGTKVINANLGGAAGSPVAFNLTVLPGAASRLVKASGDLQAAQPLAPLASPLTVQVVDNFGNGVGGVAVTWSVTSGTGSIAPPSSATDSTGRASAIYTMGPGTSVSIITAAAAALAGSPATFTEGVVTVVKEIPVPANYGEHDQFARAGLMFLCEWNTGLNIYDVGDGRAGGTLANPVLLGSIVTAGGEVHNAWWYWAPNGEKKYVFVGQEGPGSIGSSSSGDIHVVDISNVNSPIEVASYHMTNPAAGTHNFWIDEQHAILYAAYYNGGVVALDISGVLLGDLSTRQIARIQPGGQGNTYVWGVQLYNGSLYATDMVSGFYQLKLVNGAFQKLAGGA
ncbi:MAG TPA: Ig-like domain-containing protein, partial [Gemmatimonadales bacterium]